MTQAQSSPASHQGPGVSELPRAAPTSPKRSTGTHPQRSHSPAPGSSVLPRLPLPQDTVGGTGPERRETRAGSPPAARQTPNLAIKRWQKTAKTWRQMFEIGPGRCPQGPWRRSSGRGLHKLAVSAEPGKCEARRLLSHSWVHSVTAKETGLGVQGSEEVGRQAPSTSLAFLARPLRHCPRTELGSALSPFNHQPLWEVNSYFVNIFFHSFS